MKLLDHTYEKGDRKEMPKQRNYMINSPHLFSVFFAPRGNARMLQLGMQIAQQYLNPEDKLIGIIGEAGAGKSMLIKGMFPGLDLCNDDSGVNVRPLPILDIDEDEGFYAPHTYHMDVRFESAFTQMHVLAECTEKAIKKGRRVIIEHFELLYPFLKSNAQRSLASARKSSSPGHHFRPPADDLSESVYKSVRYRKMAHTAEDLVEHCMPEGLFEQCYHGDIKRGFSLGFKERPDINIPELKKRVQEYISMDLPVSFFDEDHVKIGELVHPCTGPRIHVRSTGEIENFRLLSEIFYDAMQDMYLIIGLVGDRDVETRDLNRIKLSV